MIASGGALPTEMRALYENQMEFAIAANDTAKAQRAMAELDRISPNDPNRYIRLARLRVGANDAAGAIGFYQQAIQAAQRASQPIPNEWRQQIAGLAYRNHLPDTMRYMREWLVAAPTPALWHDTLAIYGELNGATGGLKLDTYRLMRAAGAMTSERDFIELSQAANEVRAFGEVKAVLEEGLRRNLIAQNAGYARERLAVTDRRVADDRGSLAEGRRAALAGNDAAAAMAMGDAYYGYGDYAPAAELYRAALQKGADAGTANIRIGAALAMAGQRAEAETAFRAVTGARAELAQLWLLWLSTRTG
jgi:tetratricopeptide (TPR) repeat protein